LRSHLLSTRFHKSWHFMTGWPSVTGPGDESVSNRNEYQFYFLGVKATGA
jgi:hypothetical protein